jgi:hypothetical protein
MSQVVDPLLARADTLIRTQFGITLDEQDLATFLRRVTLYSGTRKLLADVSLPAAIAAPSRRTMRDLVARHPVLFILDEIFENTDEDSPDNNAEQILTSVAHLSPDDISRTAEIIFSLKNMEIDDAHDLEPDEDDSSEDDAEGVINAQGFDVSVLDDLIADKVALFRVIEPATLLLNTSVIQAPNPTPLAPAQPVMHRMFAVLFDSARYDAAAAAFDNLDQSALADTARVLGAGARLLQNMLAGQPLTFDEVTGIDRLLRANDARSDAHLAALGPLRFFVISMRLLLRRVVAASGLIPRVDRVRQLESAQQDLAQIGRLVDEFPPQQRPMLRLMVAQAPLLQWSHAMLETGDARDALQAKAMSSVNRMLGDAALEQDPVARLAQMATLAAYPVSWKYELGDFKGALEEATRAQAFAQGFAQALHQQSAPMLEELERSISGPDADARASAREFRDVLLASLRAAGSLTEVHEIHIALSHAKIAEMSGNFGRASKFYDEACEAEKATKRSVLKLLGVMVGNEAGRQAFGSQASAHEAWSSYFEAMASLNRGDDLTMSGDIVTAQANYVSAKNAFLEAEELWSAGIRNPQMAGEPATELVAAAKLLAERQRTICACRARYCDARMELATAERHARLESHRAAFKAFGAATAIFEEVLERSKDADDRRNLDLLLGSSQFSKGRGLIEVDLDGRTDGNLADARAALENAAAIFARQRELRWATYVRALAAEGMAAVQRRVLLAGPHRPDLAALIERAFAEAASLYRQIDLNDRAAELEALSRSSASFFALTRVLPPKPSGLPLADGQAGPDPLELSGLAPGVPGIDERALRTLQARGIAVERSLSDLVKRRDTGKIDEGRYLDLRSDWDLRRIEIIQDVRRLLGGRQATFDDALLAAMHGTEAGTVSALIERGIAMSAHR